jgi:DNA-binding transcriptional ArsR family regulator
MDVFEAVAEPTRREILQLLLDGEKAAGELVAAFPRLTQPAVSRHLKVLSQAGLVRMRPEAQRRMYSLHPPRLKELDIWLQRYRHFWHGHLDALENHLANTSQKTKDQ